MIQVSDISKLHNVLASLRNGARRIALVPTMGNLHAGHLSLVQQARAENDHTVVTIFVNPFQFSAGEDFDAYPRTPRADIEKLTEAGVDLVFLPSGEQIYPLGPERMAHVQVPRLDSVFCGASRPGFFRGVCTVVNILFNLIQPDKAYFGRKDYQQLLIVQRMVSDLRMPVCVVGVDTVREEDGLAMSSRNGYLDANQRQIAPQLYAQLCRVKSSIEGGHTEFTALEEDAMSKLRSAGFEPDYVAVANAVDLREPQDGESLVILAAAWLGNTRLIDNVLVNGR